MREAPREREWASRSALSLQTEPAQTRSGPALTLSGLLPHDAKETRQRPARRSSEQMKQIVQMSGLGDYATGRIWDVGSISLRRTTGPVSFRDGALDVYVNCMYFKKMAESLGARIKRLRHERELTLQAVADELGLTPAAISHWESGRIIPKSKKLHELAKALSVSVSELTGAKTPTARLQQRPMTEIDRIIADAEKQIADQMGCSSQRVRLVLNIEPS